MYAEKLAPQEKYNGDSFKDGQAAMAIVGPWAISVYKDAIDWGVVPIPTEDGKPADQIYTFSDEKSLAIYYACEHRLTAWEFVKSATTEAADGELLELTGQMPMRQNSCPRSTRATSPTPPYEQFAEQAGSSWRCRTYKTPPRSGRRSETPGPRAVVFDDEPNRQGLRGRRRASQRTLGGGVMS